MAGGNEVPQYSDMLWPTLAAVSERGDSASIGEIVDSVVRNESYTAEQQAVLHGDGPQTEIEYRLAWARTYLKGMGLLTNSKRGVWSLTEDGTALLETLGGASDEKRLAQIRERWGAYTLQLRRSRAGTSRRRPQPPDSGDLDAGRGWKESLLDALMEMPPSSFEHLAQRLLREAGFISAVVTGRSGDGGIDGVGVYRLSLVSFPVFYQCKRYRGSVGPGAVRDFRGAMAGRGDKGLLITTASFTSEAKAEATRDGAPPIDLIDGDRLCDLLKEYELGVHTTVREVEDVSVDTDFISGL